MAVIYYDKKGAPKKKTPSHVQEARARAQLLQKWIWISVAIAALGWATVGGLLWRMLS